MSGTLMERRFFTPLRSIFDDDVSDWFVGVDRMLDDMAKRWDHAFAAFNEFPSAKVEKQDDTHYRVVMKVPGYAKDEITVKRIDDELVVKGAHKENGKAGKKDMTFEQHLFLARDLKVDKAKYDNDELRIDVTFPKAAKPHEELIELT